ncbi:N-acetylglucosamine-6-phosphate deacetylase [Microbacterium sp. SORGH_AS_0888]|uniref:N-acetylglucosamine-6-phosphate deacetylase n=1 Tax=Microbacterium sp. SORGH_AS_0888 TaxID=3041791 RepID=UPI002785DCF6|nr:amidohydrolase family protein [Microbacterium sp. SORGH_AS_0888]MDQ1131293.1 N-acetylglucosamine-6-phosphate deacetylase [Microbacterium sp. SORGH_AS_0888]
MTAAPARDVLVHGVRLVSDGDESPDAWVLLRDGVVAARGTGEGWRAHAGRTEPSVPPHRDAGAADAPPHDPDAPPHGPDAGAPPEVVDAVAVAGRGAVLTPGFVDLHTHGGGGFAHEDGAAAIRGARAFHRAHGTTRAVISLVTAPVEVLAARVREVAALTGGDVLGSHLEGPFLDPGHRGAHDPALLRTPEAGALETLLAAGEGTVRQVTLAPELPGGLDAVRRVVAAGAVAAVGHTAAGWEATSAAFDAGARLLTHAFNAMPPLHHRLPGPVGAALARPDVVLEAIADGVHLHPAVVRMLMDAAPGRIALVTDAMAAAGAPDGAYRLGSLDVLVEGGVARLAGRDTIAGSTLTQDAALRLAVAAGTTLPQAVAAVTSTPASVLGRPDLGSLRVGAAGDAVLLTPSLEVVRVWSA